MSVGTFLFCQFSILVLFAVASIFFLLLIILRYAETIRYKR